MAGYREFQTGEVLTASNVNSYLMSQSVMVFADSSARDTALGTAVATGNALVEGMLTYNEDSGKLEIYNGTSWAGVSAVKKIAAFTSSGTWTVPAGVTYAIAHILGGGGGGGSQTGANATAGGASSVAFASGTITADGGDAAKAQTGYATAQAQTVPANSGRGGGSNIGGDGFTGYQSLSNAGLSGRNGGSIVAGAAVTPAASITVTVGAGGTKSTGGSTGTDGAAGYVWIEYYE